MWRWSGGTVLLTWLGIAALIGLVAGFDQVLCWTDTHSGFASWVQAIGSVGAIFVAIWVSRRTVRDLMDIEAETLRKARIEKTKTILAICSNASAVMSLFEKQYVIGGVPAVSDGYFRFLLDSAEAFKNLPLLDLPDARIAASLAMMPRQLTMLHDKWIDARAELRLGPEFVPGLDSALATLRGELTNAAELLEMSTLMCQRVLAENNYLHKT